MKLGSDQHLTILPYCEQPSPSRQPNIFETDDGLTIIYPVASKWRVWIFILLLLLISLSLAAPLFFVIQLLRGANSVRLQEIPGRGWALLVICTTLSVISWLAAGVEAMQYLRFGPVPKTLRINSHGIAQTWLGAWQMKRRTWKPIQVKSIKIKTAKHLFTRKWVYRVQIKLASKVFRLLTIPIGDEETALAIQRSAQAHLSL